MSKQVVVVDYGIGNIFSVCNALASIGALPKLSSDPAVISKADRVVLPGVGSFPKAIANLKAKGLDHAISTFIETERPFLGICVGMQMMMERSAELGDHVGLGLISGSVVKIPNLTTLGAKIKLPHVGWKKVSPATKILNTKGFKFEEKYFYFVHSYMCKPSDTKNLIATADYEDTRIAAILRRDNILCVQFHPERSGPHGLSFLKKFCE
jgi:glutamine amidotransferase